MERRRESVGDWFPCFNQDVTNSGVLASAIISRRPWSHRARDYAGRNLPIGFDFTVRRRGAGTPLMDTVPVVPMTMLARLATPFIRRSLVRHSLRTATALRRLLLTPN